MISEADADALLSDLTSESGFSTLFSEDETKHLKYAAIAKQLFSDDPLVKIEGIFMQLEVMDKDNYKDVMIKTTIAVYDDTLRLDLLQRIQAVYALEEKDVDEIKKSWKARDDMRNKVKPIFSIIRK